MALQTITTLSRAGITDLDGLAVAADAGGTDTWVGSGQEMLYVNNGSGGNLTVTLPYNGPSGTVDGQAVPNRTVVIATLKRALIGPFPMQFYNAASNNQVSVTWSTAASVKLAVVRLNPNQ